jgi:2-polyprenyl-6-methoxyphenol hydroxylase-like FAD-dependent oxidoreductase
VLDSSVPLPTETDVLVVGAGPAGLALTAALAALGVDHLTIEPKPAVDPGSKAAGVQPRTLEFLAALGAAEDLVAEGIRGAGFGLHDGDDDLLRLGYGDLDTPYPFLLLIGQGATESVLERHALAGGGRLRRGHRLLTWYADHPGVIATVTGPDGLVHTIRARYLIGADGVHSTVRQQAGITFTGTSPGALFALADVRFTDPPPDTDTAFFVSAEGVALTSPLPGGQHRVVASVPPGTGAPTAADVERVLAARAGGPVRTAGVHEVLAAATYRFQQRVAERMVDGPVALLGDAAHTHSPAGGQGMNTGIQDAADLAWRLAEIVDQHADPALLAGYQAERRPVAEELIAFTGQLTAVTTLTDPTLARLRNTVLGATGALPEVTTWLAGRLSQLDIGYGGGSGPVAGNRLSPTAFTTRPTGLSWVFATPDGAATDLPDRVTAAAAPSLADTALIRPDGVIHAVGLTAAEVGPALQRLGAAE